MSLPCSRYLLVYSCLPGSCARGVCTSCCAPSVRLFGVVFFCLLLLPVGISRASDGVGPFRVFACACRPVCLPASASFLCACPRLLLLCALPALVFCVSVVLCTSCCASFCSIPSLCVPSSSCCAFLVLKVSCLSLLLRFSCQTPKVLTTGIFPPLPPCLLLLPCVLVFFLFSSASFSTDVPSCLFPVARRSDSLAQGFLGSSLPVLSLRLVYLELSPRSEVAVPLGLPSHLE